MYVELHSRSAFSFLEGGSLPEALAITAAGLNLPGMAAAGSERLLWFTTFPHGGQEERPPCSRWNGAECQR